ncbi:uncharacterized protein LOC134239507 [Saccostrea cucullata]|uniref:uncharacterized protein LOC134239507 n=1 Tax=Saccostrea cuccullata TaxID=36930 RepID=UPI002ED23D5A
MGTLFECLKEARLEKYYQIFRINGITRSEALARLDTTDCDAIGITSPEDRRRLLDLIEIIKSVNDTDPLYNSPIARHSPVTNRKSLKRIHTPASNSNDVISQRLTPTNNVRVVERSRSAPAPAQAQALVFSESEEESESESSDPSDYEPASKHLNPASSVVRKRAVNRRVKQKGYNYGVPTTVNSSIRSSKSSTGKHGGGDEKIKVCVRKRPLNKKEIKSGEADIVSAESTTTLTVNEPKLAVDLTPHTLQHEFIFDEVFDEACGNEDVYIRAARPLINCIFEGGSATCFAYGQTGAGKTHTMIGSREIPGLYLLASHDIFSIIESGRYGQGIKVWVSYFEIYCGNLYDLLNKRNRLHAREDGSHKVCIAGLTETQATDVNSLLQILEYGNSVRSKGATGVNPDSSRSHALLQLEIRDSKDKKLGRMSFIDLAGSERASDVTDTDKQTRMEGAEINQSLLALKECIRSIDQESKHTPFRQSKLTHILKDSFVGNSRTCMIANISPTQSSCEHTLNTLRYADRVKELRRESSSGMRASTASNILMNIPLTAPSVFQPGNILCSSTPIKPKTHRHTVSRASMQDIHLDPTESPIKGHGVKRKTKPASASSSGSSVTKPQIRKPSATVASRISAVRHFPPRPSPDPLRSSPPPQQLLIESSDSDHTDSDSCNVSEKRNVKTNRNVPVVKSTDTDNDFPTTDFNNDELNDLNRTGGKTAHSSDNVFSSQSVSVIKPPGVHFSSSGHPLPVIGDQDYRSPDSTQGPQDRGNSPHRGNSPQGPSRPSPPVLRKKIYTEPSAQSSSTATESGPRKFENQVRNLPLSNNFLTNPNNNVPRVSEVSQNNPGRTVNSAKPVLQHAPLSLGSVADDDLFDGPNPSSPSQKTPRTPSTGEMNSLVLGLSRGNNVQLKIPQDPSVDPILPAVMTAKSSDLTTFSQRSPGRFSRYNPEPPPPPFSLAMVNPTESRPRILRTPPLSQPVEQNRAEQHTPPRHSPRQEAKNQSPYQIYDDRRIPTPKDHRMEEVSSDYGRFNPGSGDQFRSNKEVPDSSQNDHYARSRSECVDEREQKTRQNNLGGLNYECVDNENTSRQSHDSEEKISLAEVDPLSTNDWYNTPANRAVHIYSSVQKSTSNLDYDVHSASGYSQSNQERPEKPLEADKDIHDKFDSDLTEFLPIQKRPSYYGDRPATSRKDVASRLRSVFFKESMEKPQKHNVSNPSPINETNDSSNNRGHTTTQNKPRIAKTQEKDQLTEYGSESRNHMFSNKSGGETSGRGQSSKFNSPAITTEKLEGGGRVGSAFLPIHPQPLTTNPVTKHVVESANQDLAHPVPRDSENEAREVESKDQQTESRQIIISAHEEQLATVTSLCKQEMKLLLGAKSGHKSDEDYVRRISHILTQKIQAIQLLQDKLENYQLSAISHG